MASHQVSVTDGSGDFTQLPDWATQYVVLVQVLTARGWLAEAAALLQVARQGGYAGLDILVFLLAMFCWPRPDRRTRAIKAFSEACSFCRERLAGVADRKCWPTQGAVSRFLSAVPAGAMLHKLGARLLSQGIGPLAAHPDAQTIDTLGKSWHVFDFDPTVVAVRQRGLPEGEDLPPAVRRVCRVAEPGYPGRKRGEVIFSLGALQHAGTALWTQVCAVTGNAKVSAMLAEVLGTIRPWLAAAGATCERALVRVDGAGGNLPSFQAFFDHGLYFLTRLARYEFLQQPDVQAHLQQVRWLAVLDSASGPTRQAAELGLWPWKNHLPEDAPAGLDSARIVVTRYRAEAKHGAGVLQNGYLYELFATSLDASAWPAPELVELYYGRSSLENRFAQAMAELGVDRLFSYDVGGQWLVVLIGLWLWNLRTILGAERLGPLEVTERTPQPRTENQVTDPTAQSETKAPPPPEPSPAPPAPTLPTLADLSQRMDELNWAKRLKNLPGWRWQRGVGLSCPQGKPVPARRLQLRPHKSSYQLAFRTRHSDCAPCPQRNTCFGGRELPRYRYDLSIGVGRLLLSQQERANLLNLKACGQRPSVLLPPPLAVPGPWTPQPPRLLPAALRTRFIESFHGASVRVQVIDDTPRKPRQVWRTDGTARRQHRRLTWTERQTLGALPDTATVRSQLTLRDAWLRGVVSRDA